MAVKAIGLLRAALAGWWNDRALSLGAAIAFYTLFSLAPVLLIALAVAGAVFGREAARGAVVAEIGGLIGVDQAAAIEAMIASAGNFGSGVVGTGIGIVTFLLLATSALVELQDDLNIVWKVKPPESYGLTTFVRTRILSLAMVIAIGFLLLVSLILDAALSALGRYLSEAAPELGALLLLLNFVFALFVAILLFALIFKFLPDVDIPWRHVWAGATLTGLLFALGKFLIGFYLGTSGVASAYGAAASVVTILLWIYYSSQILLFGAEFTRAVAEADGRGVEAQAAGSPER